MARTIETEVVDLNVNEGSSGESPESGNKVSSRKLSRWIIAAVSCSSGRLTILLWPPFIRNS